MRDMAKLNYMVEFMRGFLSMGNLYGVSLREPTFYTGETAYHEAKQYWEEVGEYFRNAISPVLDADAETSEH